MNMLKKIIIKLFLVLIGLITYEIVYSQIEKSNEKIFILGKGYYLHKVKSGHTLYSISKAYGVSQQKIINANLSLKDGLKSGMELKIPTISSVVENNSIDYNNSKAQNKYIYHTVKRKQTLYFLTKKYNVNQGVLFEHNPELKNGLKTGQTIKIPKIIPDTPNNSSDYYFHKIEAGETLFSLSQKYKTDMNVLKTVNPELHKDLKVGQIIKIPKSNFTKNEILIINHKKDNIENYDFDPQYFEVAGTTPCNKFVYNKNIKFKIAVLLPLYIEENKLLKGSKRYYKNSKRFYEFYQGLLIAANKIKKTGVSVEFVIRDTKGLNGTARIRNIFYDKDILNSDLIIGPIYSENFKIASSIAKQHKINIVAPLELKYSNLVNKNPFVFLATPDMEARINIISKHLAKSYDKSIVVIHNGTAKEKQIIDIFKAKLVNSFAAYKNINKIVFKQVNYRITGKNGVEDALSIGLGNIVIIPSLDRVFITNLLTQLNYLSDKYRITTYGMLSTQYLRNVEVKYLRNLNFHYGTNSYIDYKNKNVKNFIYSYRTFFASEPSLYSFLAHDITWYFTNILKQYGKHFQFCMSSSRKYSFNNGLRYEFNYKRVSPFSGFENKWLNIIKINKNYELNKVK